MQVFAGLVAKEPEIKRDAINMKFFIVDRRDCIVLVSDLLIREEKVGKRETGRVACI